MNSKAPVLLHGSQLAAVGDDLGVRAQESIDAGPCRAVPGVSRPHRVRRMRIATWNINSIRTSIRSSPGRPSGQSTLLQETKCGDDDFPFDAFTEAGYDVVHRRRPLERCCYRQSGRHDDVQQGSVAQPRPRSMRPACRRDLRRRPVLVGLCSQRAAPTIPTTSTNSCGSNASRRCSSTAGILDRGRRHQRRPADRDVYDPARWRRRTRQPTRRCRPTAARTGLTDLARIATDTPIHVVELSARPVRQGPTRIDRTCSSVIATSPPTCGSTERLALRGPRPRTTRRRSGALSRNHDPGRRHRW